MALILFVSDFICSGCRTRTDDLQQVKLASFQLLQPAMFYDAKLLLFPHRKTFRCRSLTTYYTKS